MDIIFLDDCVKINLNATETHTFPKNKYKVTHRNEAIEVLESGTSQLNLRFRKVSDVLSITDNTTGGVGVITVPATITLLFELIFPYFYESSLTTVGSINLNTDDLERGVWDKIIGNSKEFVFYSGVEAGNPSGSVDNIKTIAYKTGATLILTQTFAWTATNKILSITAS